MYNRACVCVCVYYYYNLMYMYMYTKQCELQIFVIDSADMMRMDETGEV